MKCLLIFDHLNDVIYTKYDNDFCEHILDFANLQGFISNDAEKTIIDDNILVQIFSPIVTSQRIMCCQFGNSYTSIQCENGLNICFDDYMGYLFVCVAQEEVNVLKKYLGICISIARYLCGPDVSQLKCEKKAQVAEKLINSWSQLESNDQAVFIEAVEQLVVNSDVSSAVLQVLNKSVEELITSTNCMKIHAMLLVNNKFLSLYSSQNAKELSAADILFCMIISNTVDFSESQDFQIESLQVLMAGVGDTPSCLAYVVHVIPILEGIHLLYLVEVGNVLISSSLYQVFQHLRTMQLVQMQKELETLRPAFENFDLAMKKLLDALKKIKDSSIDVCAKQLIKKWDAIRKKYLEFFKTKSDEALLRAETLILGFSEVLKRLLNFTLINEEVAISTEKAALNATRFVADNLSTYNDFLKVKSIRNFTLGSDSLTINKYLEEFPGLVHFIYVDRVNHRMTAPTLEFTADETIVLTKNKIWSMIKFSRNHLQEGNLSLLWKDTIFNYAYFLWFEDMSGTPTKPLVYPTNSSRALPMPGLLNEDFYQ